ERDTKYADNARVFERDPNQIVKPTAMPKQDKPKTENKSAQTNNKKSVTDAALRTKVWVRDDK
ncbi:MAG: hypothetical protein J6X45_08445, partial [Lachnospiraceae bacterium]|nr:hypothetical protein [Lachnospiraceae bacterium]